MLAKCGSAVFSTGSLIGGINFSIRAIKGLIKHVSVNIFLWNGRNVKMALSSSSNRRLICRKTKT